MKLFVYEHLCGAVVGPPATPTDAAASAGVASFQREGAAMLRAVLADAVRIPGMDVTTLICGTAPFAVPGVRVVRTTPTRAWDDYERCATGATTLAIAPETDDVLLTCARRALACGHGWLGCSPTAIAATTDKLHLAQVWAAAGVPTPSCAPTQGPVIVKPRYGAGAQATYRWPTVPTAAELVMLTEQAGQLLIVQPEVPGLAASVALLVGPAMVYDLPAAVQHISAGPTIVYQGGQVPAPTLYQARARTLARAAVAAVAGLHGWVGVDLVLGADGTDYVIEINPRLTTSYVGLQALTPDNLLAAWLDVSAGRTPELRWQRGPIEFGTDGIIRGIA